jgi:hypothetical protein
MGDDERKWCAIFNLAGAAICLLGYVIGSVSLVISTTAIVALVNVTATVGR